MDSTYAGFDNYRTNVMYRKLKVRRLFVFCFHVGMQNILLFSGLQS